MQLSANDSVAPSGIPILCSAESIAPDENPYSNTFEPRHEIINNVVHVCATSKASDQPTHTRSLIRAFASRLNIL